MKLLAYLEMWSCTELLLAMFREESSRFFKNIISDLFVENQNILCLWWK